MNVCQASVLERGFTGLRFSPGVADQGGVDPVSSGVDQDPGGVYPDPCGVDLDPVGVNPDGVDPDQSGSDCQVNPDPNPTLTKFTRILESQYNINSM